MVKKESGALVHREKTQSVSPFEDLEKYFDTVFRNPFSMATMTPMAGQGRAPVLSPSVDIYDEENDIVVKAEVPGISKDALDISINKNQLTISGEKKQESKVKEKDYHRIERRYGSFSRSFRLPDGVNVDKAKAEFNDGVLEIRIPRSNKTKAKKIDIK